MKNLKILQIYIADSFLLSKKYLYLKIKSLFLLPTITDNVKLWNLQNEKLKNISKRSYIKNQNLLSPIPFRNIYSSRILSSNPKLTKRKVKEC